MNNVLKKHYPLIKIVCISLAIILMYLFLHFYSFHGFHFHSFNIANPSSEYLAKESKCPNPNKYYMSCKCGKHGYKTFYYGSVTKHNNDLKIIDDKYLYSRGTCTHGTTYYYACKCGYGHGDQTFEIDEHFHRNNTVTYKLPTDTSTGYYSVKCNDCDYEELFLLPKFDSNKYILLDYIELSGREAINLGYYMNRYESAIYYLDQQLTASNPLTGWAGANCYLQYSDKYLKGDLNRKNLLITYNILGDYVEKVYLNNTLMQSNNWGNSYYYDDTIGVGWLGNSDKSFWNFSEVRGLYEKVYGGYLEVDGRMIGLYYPVYNKETHEYGLYNIVDNKFYGNVRNGGRILGSPIVSENINNYEPIDHIDFNSYLDFMIIDDNYNYQYVPYGTSYDGANIGFWGYVNQIYFGGNSTINQSCIFSLNKVSVYDYGIFKYDLIPVKNMVTKQEGLYNQVTNQFFPIMKAYDDRIDKYFDDITSYNKEISIMGSKIFSLDETDEYLANLCGYEYNKVVYTPYKTLQPITDQNSISLLSKKTLENGKLINNYYIILDATLSQEEWQTNFEVVDENSAYHKGFYKTALNVEHILEDYIKGNAEDNKVIVIGYSKGAAVGSILTSRINEGLSSLPINKENIASYGIACPNYSTIKDKSYSNIYEIINPNDIVIAMPLNKWGYQRNGTEIVLSYDKQKVNEYLLNYQKRRNWEEKGLIENKKYDELIEEVYKVFPDPKLINKEDFMITLGKLAMPTSKNPINGKDVIDIMGMYGKTKNYYQLIKAGVNGVHEFDGIYQNHEIFNYLAMLECEE